MLKDYANEELVTKEAIRRRNLVSEQMEDPAICSALPRDLLNVPLSSQLQWTPFIDQVDRISIELLYSVA